MEDLVIYTEDITAAEVAAIETYFESITHAQ